MPVRLSKPIAIVVRIWQGQDLSREFCDFMGAILSIASGQSSLWILCIRSKIGR